MNPVLLYPLIFLAIYTSISHFSKEIDIVVYLGIAIYYTLINPGYGICATVFVLILHSINRRRQEGFAGDATDADADEPDIVPLHIYQTWNTKDLPPKMAACVESVKKDNPEFKHHLYDDAECREFIESHFEPDVLAAYDSLIPGAFKADLWRYCILYEKGGVYLDIKYKCNGDFRLVNLADDNCFVREYNGEGTGLADKPVYTGFMISKPKNPVFMKCIQRICQNVKNKYYGRDNTEPTGPILMGAYFTDSEKAAMKYSYHEIQGVGHIRHIDDGVDILSWYPEYRAEQKTGSKTSYWEDLWMARKIYGES